MNKAPLSKYNNNCRQQQLGVIVKVVDKTDRNDITRDRGSENRRDNIGAVHSLDER